MTVIDVHVPLFTSYCDLFRTICCVLLVTVFLLYKCWSRRRRGRSREARRFVPNRNLFDISSGSDESSDSSDGQNGGEVDPEFVYFGYRSPVISTMGDPPPYEAIQVNNIIIFVIKRIHKTE